MYICFCLESLGNGGAERVATNLSNAFCELGHKVKIILTSSNDVFYEINQNVELVFLKQTNSKLSFFAKKKILRKEILSDRPDIVISFFYHINLLTALALRGTNIPHVVSERNDPRNTKTKTILKFLRKHIFRKSNGCVFQTSEARAFYFKQTDKHVAIIPNPISLKAEPYFGSERKNVIFTVGRLTEQKNTKLLIDAFFRIHEKMPTFILNIYGDGPLKEELVSYTKNASGYIFFKGVSSTWQEDERQSSLFVLSSNYEGMPNALMEAMALGLPVVSTDCPVGGPRELITDGKNGLLCKTKDVSDMENSILAILSDPVFASQLSKSNENFANSYTDKAIAERWLAFFKEVLND